MSLLQQRQSPFETFAAAAARTPEAPFLLAPASARLSYAPEGLHVTYGSLGEVVERQRMAYAAAGYGLGARVALLLENRPAFFVHWLALNALGVSIVPINPDLSVDELSYQLALSRADLLVVTGDHAERVCAVPGPVRVVVDAEPIPPCTSPVSAQAGTRGSECALLFTSGSTGKPKGCILSNDYFLRIADWFGTQGGIAALHAEGEVNLTPLPMFHMNALGCSAVGMMAVGGAVVPLDRFHASRWWESVADSGATMMHCLGVIPAILLQLSPSEAERRHRVRFAFAPGVDVRHRAAFEERFGIPIVDAWAMTETGGAACTTTAREPAGYAAHCIGRPVEGMEYRIVDDAGRDAPTGTPGEFLVRAKGPDPRQGFFGGYLDDEAATAEAWDGGWFHTGDYIRAEADGLLYFFDRKKSIVRRSGENIAVLEVESILHRLDPVQASAVAPVPDELRGEEVFAFVVRAPGAAEPEAALAEAIVRDCALALAYHKVPGYVAFVEVLPLSATKKLARGEIKAAAARAVEGGTAFDLRPLKAGLRKGR